MATYNWSALANGQTIDPFNPDLDVIHFDSALISAADIFVNGHSEPPDPVFISFSYGGKTVAISMNPLAATTTNVTFANGSLLLIGDNTTGTASDDGINTLTGGSGNDQFIGLGGADSMSGNGGNDLFTMYTDDNGKWGNDTIRGGGGTDTINFNTGDPAISGLTVLFTGFDGTIESPGLGTLGTITGGDGAIITSSTISMSGVERITGTDLADTFTGTVAIPVNSLRSDVTLQFDGAGGNDTFTGATGNGRNTIISYQSAGSGVTVNLGTGTANDGLGGTDSFTNIDGVFGSNYSDLITGGSASRSINNGLFEFFEGFSGNDTINGGNGGDRVQYVNSPGAVTVNLATGTASDGWVGAFTSITTVDTNGEWGLSHGGPSNLYVSGDTLTAKGIDGSFVFSRVTNPANALVGSWYISDGNTAILTFLSDGTYFLAEDGDSGDPSGQDGMERGTYTWDSVTGAFTSITTVDTNGEWGLSDGSVSNMQVTGDTLTATDSEGSFAFSRVVNATNPLVGGWFLNDGNTTVVTFLSDGSYFLAEDGDSVAEPGGVDGMERGTYTWNPLAGTDTLISIEQVRGSNFADTLTGNASDNRLTGDGGNDTLDGGDGFDQASYQFATNAISVNLATGTATDIGGTSNGTDSLISIESVRGTDFADSLVGGGAGDEEGQEAFEGRAGNDTIDGGDDVMTSSSIDIASYLTSPSGAIVNLSASTAFGVASNSANDGFGVNGNTAGIDSLLRINGIEGSSFSDTLVGGNIPVFFDPRAGNDSVVGGSSTNDWLTYYSAPAGVNVNLTTGTATDGWGGTDALISIEDVEGSEFNDSLTGSSESNDLTGLSGNDTLFGALGDDRLNGRAGNDLLQVSQGADSLDGGEDSDTIDFTLTGITYTGTTAVNVDLATGVADLDRSAPGANSTLISIETVIGTAGDDIFVGGDVAHETDSIGNSISERFRGGAGNDSITGGTSNGLITIADYANNSNVQAVSANLFTGLATDGLGGTDTLVNVDRLHGGAGNDLLVGGGLSRSLTGSFQEYFRGNAGNDTMDSGNTNGGGGDRADYSNNTSAQAINVNLATGIVLDGLGGTDTLIDIFQIAGGAGNDSFLGSAGNDSFDGGAGNDTLDGAGGSDEARFSQSTARVIVNLSAGSILVDGVTVLAGTANDGMGGTDTLISIENVRGSDFNDHIRGSDNVSTRQFLNGDAGNDTIDGGAGIDFANYSAGALVLGGINAFIENGSGTVNDKMGGTDTLLNIEGLGGTNSNDTLTGGLGDQWFRGNGGSDSINGGAGNDWVLYSNSPSGVTINLGTGTAADGYNGAGLALGGTDTLVSIENAEGSDYNDSITGSSAANELRGRDGNDILSGGAGNDTIDGGAGDDFINYGAAASGVTVNLTTGVASDGDGGTDSLSNIENIQDSAYGDDLTGSSVRNFIYLGAGNDTVDGAGDIDTVSYELAGAGVTINLFTDAATGSTIGTDVLTSIEAAHGSQYADIITLGNDGNNVGYVFGRAGDDSLTGGNNDDTFFGGSGNDTINGGAGIDRAGYMDDGGDAAGPITQGINANLATGSVIDGWGNTDTVFSIESLSGTHLADTLVGSNAGDLLSGEGGNDSINGGDGNDTIAGGDGNDTLSGGLGVDTVWYVDGTGSITQGINANLATGSVVDGWGNTDTLTSIEKLLGTYLGDTMLGGDGTYDLNGEAGNDSLVGGIGNDSLFGGDGNDTLDGGANIDQLRGDEGNDSISGGDGNDYITGGDGDDTLVGGAGTDTADYFFTDQSTGIDANLSTGIVTGGGGTDSLSSIEVINGTTLDDLITGNTNANTLFGNSGNDTLVGGDGNDTLSGGDGNDTLSGGDGSDILRVSSGADTLDGGADSDTIDFTAVTGVTYGGTTAVNVNLATGIADLNRSAAGDDSTLISIETVFGTAGDDIFVGGDVSHNADSFGNNISERFRGGAGNDNITGGTANGLITIADYANNSNIQAVSANLFTGLVSDGLGGTDTLIHVDRLHGGAGNDLLVGGGLSRSASGNFQEYFRGNAGNDTMNSGNTNGGGGDRADYSNNTSVQAINVNLATGIVLDGLGGTDTLIDIFQIAGGAGNDTFLGSAGNDSFDGGAGNDTLDGADGSDEARFAQSTAGVIVNLSAGSIDVNGTIVLAGTANDGMGGTDTLISIENVRGSDFNDHIRGSDNVSTRQFLNGDAGNDTIDGGAGIDFANYSAGALVLGGINAFIENGSGTVNDKMGGTDTLINIEGLGGTNSADTLTGGLSDQWFRGNGGSDSINGGAGNDWVLYSTDPTGVTINLGTGTATDGFNGPGGLLALGGTDTLVSIENAEGSDFNDSITGSSAANELRGRDGNDTINGGAGNDTLLGGSGNDSLDGGADIDTADYAGVGAGIAATMFNNTVANDGQGGADTISNIENLIGSAFNDSINGSATANRLDGGAGNDQIFAGGGNDTLIGGEGNDTLGGAAGNDSIDGGNGTDTADYTGAGVGISLALFSGVVSNDGQGGADTISNIENLNAGGFNDTISGSAVANRLDGGAGNDLIFAGGGDDTLVGGEGNDTLNGAAGNDSIDGGNGIDTADYTAAGVGISLALFSGVVANDGQSGSDTISNIENLNAGGFNDTISGSSVANRLDGGAGNDLIFAGAGDDTLVGGEGNDTLNGAAGNDSIDGGNGIDTADYTSATVGLTLALFSGVVANDGQGGADTILNIENLNAGGFNDTISGSAVANRLDGGAGNDLIFAGAGDDTLVGGEGNDTLNGAAGNDSIDGGNGIDTADYTSATAGLTLALFSGVVANDGQSGSDTISNIENLNAGGFNDTISGSAVANRLDGGAGNDLIFAGAGDDTLVGGEGNDTLNGAAGNDSIDGGNGIDTADYTSATAGLTLALFSGVVANDGQSGSDTISNIENVTGSGFNDTINGSSVANRLDGGAGNDSLFAGAGDDTLIGGANDDTLSGSSGNDQLTGGTGQDAFLFDAALGAGNIDTITDFVVVDDTIQLENGIFTGLVATGALAAGSFVSGAGAAALDADDYILYDTATGFLSYDADGNGAVAAQQFAMLNGLPGILASDFMVV